MRSGNFASRPVELEKCWAFVRGDMDIPEFENWLYFDSIDEISLGPDAYLDAVSTDFGSPKQVNDLRHWLAEFLPAPATCTCHTIPNGHLSTIGSSSPDTFNQVESATAVFLWEYPAQCKVCATEWWVVEESRIYDVWILFRGWDNPPKIDTYRGLLALAVDKGARVQYVDPYMSIEIPAAIENLANETPGIAVSELASLLLIPLDVIRFHAHRALQEAGFKIDLES